VVPGSRNSLTPSRVPFDCFFPSVGSYGTRENEIHGHLHCKVSGGVGGCPKYVLFFLYILSKWTPAYHHLTFMSPLYAFITSDTTSTQPTVLFQEHPASALFVCVTSHFFFYHLVTQTSRWITWLLDNRGNRLPFLLQYGAHCV